MSTNREKRLYSPTKQKVLALLNSGRKIRFIIGGSKKKKVFQTIPEEFSNINKRYLYQILNEFHLERLVNYKEHPDGMIEMVLSEKGKHKTLRFDFDNLTIPQPKKWDKKWRLVCFDIPEKKRNLRDALRDKLRYVGFIEWQKSLFVYPYLCKNEIDFIIEVLEAREYVTFLEAITLNPDAKLKLIFKL